MSKLEEIWKKIPQFDRYEVSNFGRIRILKNGYVMTPVINKLLGYVQYTLTGNDGKKHTKRVNRLVGENHIPRVHGKDELNHIDGNKLNNTVMNLEWCTSSENKKHAYACGLRKKKHRGIKTMVKTNSKKCIVVDNNTKEEYFFDSYAEASRFFGKSSSWAKDIVYGFAGHTKKYDVRSQNKDLVKMEGEEE